MDLINQKDADTSFEDIAGIDTVKEEILEVIEFLRNPKRFLDLGARSPAGILLVGPPGTGTSPASCLSARCQCPSASYPPVVGAIRCTLAGAYSPAPLQGCMLLSSWNTLDECY